MYSRHLTKNHPLDNFLLEVGIGVLLMIPSKQLSFPESKLVAYALNRFYVSGIFAVRLYLFP